MSSILTNNSAMVALQTLKSINMDLGKVQSEISTGKTVESAKDNAAVWAISKVMSSDVEGFNAISDSLSLGQATVGVALNGAETITDLLTEIKGKIVNAQESNVDRTKIQTDIEALTDQITSIVGAAQFNGLNLLNQDASVNILSSLDRAADGTVTDNNIAITAVNLGTAAGVVDTTGGTYAAAGGSAAATLNATQTQNYNLGAPTAGTAYSISIAGTGAFSGVDTSTQANADDIAYVARDGDTNVDVAEGLVAAFDAYAAANGIAATDLAFTVNGTTGLTATSTTTDGTDTFAISVSTVVSADNQAEGALRDLTTIDVSTETGADAALDSIESLIQTSIDTAASFGSSGRQIDTQMEFVGKLTDLLVSGIGTLVDADMEAASAKLQALQTQQQLGVQALSIANQAPQTILSLFR
ncbi:MAG: flagellin [Pseudomonadota bacterium]